MERCDLDNTAETSQIKRTSLIQSKISKWVDRLRVDAQSRLVVFLFLLVIGFLTIHIMNNVVANIDPDTWAYQSKRVFPTYPPAGNDFRVGYYWPAQYLLETNFTAIGPDGTYPSNYPPLVALSSLPYLLFNITNAYAVHVVVLILANLACLFMAVMLVKRFLLENIGISSFSANIISLVLFFVTAIYLFSSYFFAYSMERGNTDILALFYSMLAVCVLVKRPNNIWLQVILLSVAVHFKIYPAALFALLLFKHGKKLILPALVVNLAFLFCLGPKMALSFFRSMSSGGQGVGLGNAWSNVANHASYSFTIGIDKSGGEYLTGTFFIVWAITILIPLLIWGITSIAIVLKKYSNFNAVLFFMISVPLMNLLPTVSMDYKLVILAAVALILMGLILRQFLTKFSWFDVIQMILLMGVLLMMSRSYAYIDESMVFIRNKYVWVLLLEVFMAVNVFRAIDLKKDALVKKSRLKVISH